ncbi:uncharacterized protein L201_001053 [Kwoniella dendrophila CBS 6074]|uniref:WSC domain-containing protein n=1 Tax=Kwoniella dendrophila CBS 6074 TaxID=1295534 RepID=A0AAX4JNP5_9TREE
MVDARSPMLVIRTYIPVTYLTHIIGTPSEAYFDLYNYQCSEGCWFNSHWDISAYNPFPSTLGGLEVNCTCYSTCVEGVEPVTCGPNSVFRYERKLVQGGSCAEDCEHGHHHGKNHGYGHGHKGKSDHHHHNHHQHHHRPKLDKNRKEGRPNGKARRDPA